MYQIFSPLEIFRQVLHNFGNDTKQFGAFARTIDPVELCVMALGVLCSESSMDSEIKVSIVKYSNECFFELST